MGEENVSQKFRLKNIEEIKNDGLMTKRHKKVSTTLNYSEHFLILVSVVTECI